MAVEYSNIVPIRMTTEDVQRSEAIAKRLRTPRSTLIRRVWCEWLDAQAQSTEKTAS